MPTMHGSIWAQYVQGIWAYNGSYELEIRPLNRDITAYSALTRYGFIIPSNGHSPPYLYEGYAGISRVVSDGHSEDFNPPIQFVKRNNVTEIRFLTLSYYAYIYAVHVINYWE